MSNKAIAIFTVIIFAISLLFTIPVQTRAQVGPMMSDFCNAIRMGVAQGPQSSFCSLQSSPLQSQQLQTGVGTGNTAGVCLPQLQQIMGCSSTPYASTPGSPSTSTSTSVCSAGYTLQSGFCVPTSTTTATSSTSTCPTNSILENGVCVSSSTTTPTPTVTPTPPTANAGTNQTVVGGTVVVLNGAGSAATTSGATITSYQWSQTSGSPTVSLTGANTVTPTFQAPTVANDTTLAFSLAVTDSNGQVSSPSTVTITVKGENESAPQQPGSITGPITSQPTS